MGRTSAGILACFLIAAAAFTGCSGAPLSDVEATLSAGADDQIGSPVLRPEALTQRVYFGLTSRVVLSQAAPTFVAMDLLAGAKVRLELSSPSEEPVAFKVLRVRADGTTETLQPLRSTSGFDVATTLHAAANGTFVIAFAKGSRDESVAALTITCAREHGRCAAQLQPGEACFPGAWCDEGLECRGDLGECNPAWKSAKCAPKATEWGCDGRRAQQNR